MSKKKGTQVGNFIVTSEQGTFEHIKVVTVSGNWSMRIRSDMQMYKGIKDLFAAEKAKEIPREQLVSTMTKYATACMACALLSPDDPFLEAFWKIHNERVKRIYPEQEKLTKEQDDVILDDERKAYEEAHKEEIKTEE